MVRRAFVLALATLLAETSACGGDKGDDKGANQPGEDRDAGEGTGMPAPQMMGPDNEGCVKVDPTPAAENDGITLPDSYCDDEKCEIGTCDPKGVTEPACNAWLIEGTGAFHAVQASTEGSFGLPAQPTKTDSEICPGFTTSPADVEQHCCQRVLEQGSEPALKLAGLNLLRPRSFAAAAVAQSNKNSIDGDLYNWMIVLSSAEDGEGLATSGNALPNQNGSFASVSGAFESGGQTWNSEGEWNAATSVPTVLASQTDGSRRLCVGPSPSTKDLTMNIWFDPMFDFSRLQLPMRGVTWDIPLTNDLVCSGLRSDTGVELVARLRSFMTVEAAKRTGLALAKTGGAINLCAYLAGVPVCNGEPGEWTK